MEKIRVAAVSYLNTKPLLYGIHRQPIRDEIKLIEDFPSKIARMVIEDEVDMGLIPVAAILKLKEWHIIGTHCIGAEGPVASVCLFSEAPLEQIERVYLDYQSRTSVNLAKLLLKEYWKKEVKYIDATGEDFRQQLRGTTAGVVIGDRALQQRKASKYIYDLGEAWKNYTGLPFVFAAWIANKPLPLDFVSRFDQATGFGLQHLAEVVAENPFDIYDLKTYYSKNISYRLTDQKREGMALFLSLIKKL